MRSRLLCLVALAGAAIPALADYCPTAITWRTWTVSSSEDRYLGAKYGDRYNLRNLFDRDPKTAWVFERMKSEAPTGYWGGKYVLEVENEHGVVLDGVKLVAGYAKSPDVFRRNNRVREVEVYGRSTDDWHYTLIAHAKLRDSEAWQEVKLPRRKYGGIRLVAKSFYPGQDRDFALSELMVTRDGQDVMNPLPKAMLYTKGDECGCGTVCSVIDRKARILGQNNTEVSGDSLISKDRRYCVILKGKGNTTLATAFDLERGTIERSIRLPGFFDAIQWNGNRRVTILSYSTTKPSKPVDFRF